MSAIKEGDWVMVVRGMPCCGISVMRGKVFTVTVVRPSLNKCRYCGHEELIETAEDGAGYGYMLSRLKKIDPPAEGDTLPTRAETHDEVPA